MNYIKLFFVIVLMFFNIKTQKYIYLRNELKVRKKPYFFYVLDNIKPLLKKYGVVISKRHYADAILTNAVTSKQLSKKIPLIIIEDNDYSTISSETRSILSLPFVKAVFQNYSLNPRDLNNEECFAGLYHCAKINTRAKVGNNSNFVPIKAQYLDKIKNVPCMDKHFAFCAFNEHPSKNAKNFNWLRNQHFPLKKERNIDVFFVGSLSLSTVSALAKRKLRVKQSNQDSNKRFLNAIYGYHRNLAFQTIKSIPNINACVGELKLDYPDYIEKMRDAKIVVSPWGWGEFCWRDFEAMLTGAILIKPNTSFIASKPMIYQNHKTYIPCKDDFSDLKEIVSDVLNNYEKFDDMRNDARKILIDYTLDDFAKDFAQEVKNLFMK